jgi:hypothetical protein
LCAGVATLAAIAVMLCQSARAEDGSAAGADCKLTRLASLPMTTLSDGQLGVPVILGGKEQVLALGLSDPYSFLYESYVKAQSLPVTGMPRSGAGIEVGNSHAKGLASVPGIKIGMISGKDRQFAVFDDTVGKDNGSVGELALDFLAHFDVDIDFDKERLNLLSQDHCQGNVVYWASDYAAVPFQTDITGHPSVRMELDGQRLTVAFASNPGPGRMTMAAAKRLFDIDETASGMKVVAVDASGAPEKYRYPFQHLTIEGVTVNNPDIDLDPTSPECRPELRRVEGHWKYCFGSSDLVLGFQELKQLHLYFAFKEKKLYVTPASAEAPKVPSSASGPPASLGQQKS